MSDSPRCDFAFDPHKFKSAYRALQYIFSCKTIGDATAYELFFEKQCQEANPEAVRLQTEMSYIDKVDHYINRSLDVCSTQKMNKVSTIIKLVASMSTFHVTEQQFFCVCALDGVVMRNGVQIHDANKNVHITIQHKYKYFLLAFWLITNIQTICQQRINSFVRINGRDKSIQLIIQTFNETYNTDDDEYSRVFTWAYEMVTNCLTRTVRQNMESHVTST